MASRVHYGRTSRGSKEFSMAQKKDATTRDVVTLADLAPRHDVKGGSQRRVFGADPIDASPKNRRTDMKPWKATKKAKDLPSKSSVKGGGQNLNDNMTLVRAAKPAKKVNDLAPKSPGRVKGGTGGHGEKLAANDNITLVRGVKPTAKKGSAFTEGRHGRQEAHLISAD
jgi:hypothetical protein